MLSFPRSVAPPFSELDAIIPTSVLIIFYFHYQLQLFSQLFGPPDPCQ